MTWAERSSAVFDVMRLKEDGWVMGGGLSILNFEFLILNYGRAVKDFEFRISNFEFFGAGLLPGLLTRVAHAWAEEV